MSEGLLVARKQHTSRTNHWIMEEFIFLQNIILSPPRYFHESPTTAESSFLIKKPSISLRVASSSTVSVSWIHYDDDVKDVKEDSALGKIRIELDRDLLSTFIVARFLLWKTSYNVDE